MPPNVRPVTTVSTVLPIASSDRHIRAAEAYPLLDAEGLGLTGRSFLPQAYGRMSASSYQGEGAVALPKIYLRVDREAWRCLPYSILVED
ncbi:hypothetical protein A6U87_09105 [Rhizobium sp. AC44/96]|nr:hypothetical protein A6U87_09105 [Rhizobium sp. AC44/96]